MGPELVQWEIEGQTFECDPNKSERTYRLRGFDFGYAAYAYFDENVIFASNSFDSRTGEERFHLIGRVREDLLFVVFCVRTFDDGKEIIHIISARYAETADELAAYYEP